MEEVEVDEEVEMEVEKEVEEEVEVMVNGKFKKTEKSIFKKLNLLKGIFWQLFLL